MLTTKTGSVLDEREDLPRIVYLETTNLCNAACVMCPREKLTRKKGVMNFGEFKVMVDQLRAFNLEWFSLTGFGEPLINRSMVDCINYAKAQGINPVMINSNAALLAPSLSKEILHSKLDLMCISFYGSTVSQYEQIMSGLKRKKTIEAVLCLLKEKRRACKQGPVIRIAGLGWFNLILRLDYLLATNIAAKLLRPYLGLRSVLSKAPRFYWHNYGDARSFNAVEPQSTSKRSCRFIDTKTMTIWWNGDVVSCCRDYDGKVVFGNVLSEGVANVWQKKSYVKFREDITAGITENYPLCHACDMLTGPRSKREVKIRLKERVLFALVTPASLRP